MAGGSIGRTPKGVERPFQFKRPFDSMRSLESCQAWGRTRGARVEGDESPAAEVRGTGGEQDRRGLVDGTPRGRVPRVVVAHEQAHRHVRVDGGAHRRCGAFAVPNGPMSSTATLGCPGRVSDPPRSARHRVFGRIRTDLPGALALRFVRS
jgi:hypothetical protein